MWLDGPDVHASIVEVDTRGVPRGHMGHAEGDDRWDIEPKKSEELGICLEKGFGVDASRLFGLWGFCLSTPYPGTTLANRALSAF